MMTKSLGIVSQKSPKNFLASVSELRTGPPIFFTSGVARMEHLGKGFQELIYESFQYADCGIARLIPFVAIEVAGNEVCFESALVNDSRSEDGFA
jgi:hypothetical protein